MNDFEIILAFLANVVWAMFIVALILFFLTDFFSIPPETKENFAEPDEFD